MKNIVLGIVGVCLVGVVGCGIAILMQNNKNTGSKENNKIENNFNSNKNENEELDLQKLLAVNINNGEYIIKLNSSVADTRLHLNSMSSSDMNSIGNTNSSLTAETFMVDNNFSWFTITKYDDVKITLNGENKTGNAINIKEGIITRIEVEKDNYVVEDEEIDSIKILDKIVFNKSKYSDVLSVLKKYEYDYATINEVTNQILFGIRSSKYSTDMTMVIFNFENDILTSFSIG